MTFRRIGWVLKWIIFRVIAIFVVFYLALWTWGLFVKPTPLSGMTYGVTFSDKYAKELGLDWQKSYLAILDDLKVRNLRLIAYWPEIEATKGQYKFNDLDFQMNLASSRKVSVILAVGRRLPRWPECHEPDWAKNGSTTDEDLLAYIKTTILRYRNNPTIKAWQIENEPFLEKYGICSKTDSKLLDQEIALVKSLDSRQVIITDSGEFGLWIKARPRADIFGITLYRYIWNTPIGYVRYPLPPTFYRLKNFVSRVLSGENFASGKKVIVIEMQAETWGPKPAPYISLDQQSVSFDLPKFSSALEFERKTGLNEVYLWGAEWWYWLKEKHNDSHFWDYAKELFMESQ